MDPKIKEEILGLVENGYIYKRSPKRVGNKVYIYLVPPEGGRVKSYSIGIESEEDFVYLKRELPWRMRSISGKSYYTGSKRRKKSNEDITDASYKSYQRALDEFIARNIEHISKRNNFISTLIEKIGFNAFMILLSKMHISLEEWEEFRKDPDKLADRILEFLITVIEHYEDPDRLERVEKENEKLKQKNKELREKLKEKDAFIEEYKMQLSGMSTMLTSLQYKRFVDWNNLRYSSGWSTLTPEQAKQAYFVPIPYNRDDEMFEHMLETAATMKMTEITFGSNEGVPSSLFINFGMETISLLRIFQRDIASNYKNIIELWKGMVDLQLELLRVVYIVLTQQNRAKQIIEVKLPSQQNDEYLESQEYNITPPCDEDCVRKIVEESKSPIIDKETATIIMNRGLKIFDKWIASKLYNEGKMSKDEFSKIMNFEKYHTAKMPS